jgi:ATP-dependent DNA helicase RecG
VRGRTQHRSPGFASKRSICLRLLAPFQATPTWLCPLVTAQGDNLGLEPEALKGEHASRPRNPLIADVIFRRGLIERWGRGTQVIVEECERAGCLEPNYSLKGGCFVATFPVGPESGPDSRPESELARGVQEVLQNGPLGKADIAKALGHRSISAILNRTIRQLLADGRIAFTLPEKPNSRLQRYQLRSLPRRGEGS